MTLVTPRNLAIAAGLAVGAVGAGAVVRHVLHRDDGPAADSTAGSQPKQGVDHLPTYRYKGRDMAVAWWPEGMHLDHDGGDTKLRFQTIVGNLGVSDAKISAGDHVQYEVFRVDGHGQLGERVGTGSASLERLDVQAFPPPFGEAAGQRYDTFGKDLKPVDHLAPQTIGIIGAGNDQQVVDMHGAGKGSYMLRQTIVRADRTDDPDPHNDVRDTGFLVGADGEAFQVSSAYAG
jgi:hypothetical protein